jgi:hypothetical protein
VKPHVRALFAQIDPLIFIFKQKPAWPFWQHGDYQVPADFKVRILAESPYAWKVEFVAPAWIMLAHPDAFPKWQRMPKVVADWWPIYGITVR